MEKENKFIIITPSYNNEQWVEYNLASVLNQTYTNWEMVYINDCSTDKTGEIVDRITKDNNRICAIHNELNRGAMYNYFETGLSYAPDDSIVVHLDGDDWLFDEYVLEKLNTFYNKRQCLMAYGGMAVWRGGDEYVMANPQNTPHPDIIHKSKSYRRDTWRASMMRSYKVEILRAINKNDLIDKRTNEYYWQASDLSFQYPALEMCEEDRIGVLDFNAYVYNATPGQSVRTREREDSNNHVEIEIEIRNKRKYNRCEYDKPITKMKQINAVGYNPTTFTLPKDFSFVTNRVDGEYDVTILNDHAVSEYLNNQINYNSPIIADVYESVEFPGMKPLYDLILANWMKFDLILTQDVELLKLPNAVERLAMWGTFFYGYEQQPLIVEPNLIDIIKDRTDNIIKTKDVMCISSNKGFLPGHKIRLDFIQYLLGDGSVDLYGHGFNSFRTKFDLLDYKFCVVIENNNTENGFTEKINDCFLTKTIPIYYGAPNLDRVYDSNSFFVFNTIGELDKILDEIKLNPDKIYNDKLPYLIKSQEIAFTRLLTLESYFNKYVQPIIEKNEKNN